MPLPVCKDGAAYSGFIDCFFCSIDIYPLMFKVWSLEKSISNLDSMSLWGRNGFDGGIKTQVACRGSAPR